MFLCGRGIVGFFRGEFCRLSSSFGYLGIRVVLSKRDVPICFGLLCGIRFALPNNRVYEFGSRLSVCGSQQVCLETEFFPKPMPQIWCLIPMLSCSKCSQTSHGFNSCPWIR